MCWVSLRTEGTLPAPYFSSSRLHTVLASQTPGASPDALVFMSGDLRWSGSPGWGGRGARPAGAGTTPVRDLGERGSLALRLREHPDDGGRGPPVVAPGPPITRTGGHCWYLGGEAEGADQLVAAVAARAR